MVKNIRINDDDLNHLKTCFNYEFKKNEIIEKYLIIGDLLVIIFLYFILFYLNNI